MFQGKMKAITFSYDDGVVQDRRLISLLNKYGLKATFNLNSEWFGLKHMPSAHHLEAEGNTYELCKQFIEMQTDTAQLLYIWGHSYELDWDDRWGELEEIFKLISGREDIFYGTNREVFEQII